MTDNKTMRTALVIGALLLLLYSMNTVPLMSVAEIEGKTCWKNSDCPCWGQYKYGNNETAYGVGAGKCIEGKCDMTYCMDLKPAGTWLKDNPWQFLKSNPIVAFVIVIAIIGAIFWPKM